MKKPFYITAIFLFFAVPLFGQGTILWDESVNGPLSNFSGSPNSLGELQVGNNYLFAGVERVPFEFGWIVTNDFFTFSIPNGFEVSSVQLTVNRPVVAWIGNETFSTPLGLLVDPLNGELLGQWNLGSLSPGLYGMYLSNDDAQSFPTTADYSFNFFLQPIPEPSALSLLLVGAGIVFLQRRGTIKSDRGVQ